MLKHTSLPSIEEFATYLDGNLSANDMQQFTQLAAHDGALHQLLDANSLVDETLNGLTDTDLQLPSDLMSADFELPTIAPLDEAQFANPMGLTDIRMDNSLLTLVDTKTDNNDSELYNHNDDDEVLYNNFKIERGRNMELGKLSPNDIQQQYPDTCAIKSQQIILESHDIDVSEDELVQESMDKGWYEPGSGTAPENVGNLLEEHGVGVNRFEHATLDDIAAELAQGHQVIVGVDSGELWNPGAYESFEDFINGVGADHALIVSGINVNPLTGEREVVLTDPGTGEVAHTYTAEQFEDAWDDSDNFMMTTDF